MMKKLRPYLTAFRVRASLEFQYRGAALGGLITQVFFGLILVYLYQALFAGKDPDLLAETITYVWLQQMFFRLILSIDGELSKQIMTGGIAYTLCRPVNQYDYWLCRCLAMKSIGALMRCAPMIAIQFVLPADIRMALPASPVAFLQFLLGLALGTVTIAQIENICMAITMKTLDGRGISAMLRLLMMIFSGNIIPLTLFPESVQRLMQYQPFAQALDAPTRMYLSAQAAPEWLLNTGVQLLWILLLGVLGRAMWAKRLKNMIVQGG